MPEGDLAAKLWDVLKTDHAKKSIFPHMLALAGRELTGGGLVLALTQAMNLSLDDVPEDERSELWSFLLSLRPDFVEALVNDPEVLREARVALAVGLMGQEK